MKSKSNQKGITLIALVLIIVGVVVLVGILLNVVFKKDKTPNNPQVGIENKQEEQKEEIDQISLFGV